MRVFSIGNDNDAYTANPVGALKYHWNNIPGGTVSLVFYLGVIYAGICQKINETYGSCIIFSYSLNSIIYVTKNGSDWVVH